MVTAVETVGDFPDRGDRVRLLLLYANTATERAVLEAFVARSEGALGRSPQQLVAWFQDDKDKDEFNHADLIERLGAHPSLDIIPIGVAWKPKSDSQQSWREISAWMKLVDSNGRQNRVLKRQPERCAIIIGEFGTQKALQARYRHRATSQGQVPSPDPKAFADFVALQAALTIERDARAVTGESVKYPRHVKRSIWARPDFQAALSDIAKASNRSLDATQTEARECMKELIPAVRPAHVSLSSAFSRRVCRLGYDQDLVYDQEQMAEIRKLALTRPVALVWTHKTHIDGMAMLLASRQEHFPLVHLIGGDNMAFFGIGYMMRRAGSIFIRRSIDSDVYKLVLQSYLGFLLEKRFPVSWALEGTRSRNGKLMPPRFGILKYIVEAANKAEMKDLTLVPVSIYYDLIAELGDYAREQTGATKRKESLAWFAGYIRNLRKPLGRISLGLGEPVVVDTTSEEMSEALEGGGESFSVALQKLAFEASVSANSVTPVTPSSLVSLALTGAAPQALTGPELSHEVRRLRDWALERGCPMTQELEEGDREEVERIISTMIDIGVISRYDEGPEAVYSVAEGRHFDASYYRNNAIHFFVTQAIIELALAKATSAVPARALQTFWDEAAQLRDTFKFEFFYPEQEAFAKDIEVELARHEENWQSLVAAGHANDVLHAVRPHMSHAVLRPFAEAYGVIAEVLQAQGSGPLDEKVVVAQALKLGRQSYLQRKITSEESIGLLMFSNGFKLAKNRGLVPDSDVDMKAARLSFSRELNDIGRRLRMVRDIAEQQRREKGTKSIRGGDGDRASLTVVGEN